MSINPKQSWMQLCDDIKHICRIVDDPFRFAEAIGEVNRLFKHKNRRDMQHIAPIRENGEKYPLRYSSAGQKGLHISVSVVEA